MEHPTPQPQDHGWHVSRLSFGRRCRGARNPLLVVLAAACLTLGAGSALAEDIQLTGPLADAPACRHCRVYREGRLQVQPFLAFTLQDQYVRHRLLGAQVSYHLMDWLGLGLVGAFNVSDSETPLTREIGREGQTTEFNVLSLPSADNFAEQVGRIQWFTALQLSFIPLRGKLALFQKVFVDADFQVFAGAAMVGVEERQSLIDPSICSGVTASPACLQSQVARISRSTLAPTFGAALTLMFSDWAGMALEWRGLPFAWNTSGTDEAGPAGKFSDGVINADDRIPWFNHMFSLGAVFYVPPKVSYTP